MNMAGRLGLGDADIRVFLFLTPYLLVIFTLQICVCTDESISLSLSGRKRNEKIPVHTNWDFVIRRLRELQGGFDSGPFDGCVVFWDVDTNLVIWLGFEVSDAG